MIKKRTLIAVTTIILVIGQSILAASESPAPTPNATPDPDPYACETNEQRDARMAWWRDARFGLFIHWGVYAVPAGTHKGVAVKSYGEWIMNKGNIPIEEYKPYAKEFNPTKYDADAWVRLAKRAGMKYIVITAKHHDGFALWPSTASDWDIEATPYKNDLLKPLAEACKKHGLKLGFYYSHAQDWINGGAGCPDPDIRTMDEYIDEIAVPQVRELLTNYGEAPAILWWDTPAAMNEQRAAKLIAQLKLKPGIIHNNRLLKVSPTTLKRTLGKEELDSFKSDQRLPYSGDTETPEQHIPATGLGKRDWEACMTINRTWGFKKDDVGWKSTQELLHNLIDIASKGGNYLLNVGPTAEGLIPEACIERLEQMGAWLQKNGESIYGSSASPFAKLPWGRCTTKVTDAGTTLYLHVFDWPKDGKLLVPGLENEVTSARLLIGGEKLTFEKTESGVVLDLPVEAPDPIASVITLEVPGEPRVSRILIKPTADGSIALPASLVDFAPTKGQEARLQPTNEGMEIGYWENPDTVVSWTFLSETTGNYEISAEVSGLKDAAATIEIGTQKIRTHFTATGNYHTYKSVNLGSISIPTPGEHTLTIHPDAGNWNAVNLKKITLQPAK